MVDYPEDTAQAPAPKRARRTKVGHASLDGTRLTLTGVASLAAGRLGSETDGGGRPHRTFVLRERDKEERRRFRVEPGTDPDETRFRVALDLASRDRLPARETVWDAYVEFESGDTRVERRVAASLTALPAAATVSARRSTYQVVPYATKHGNLSFRVTSAPRPRRTEKARRWVVRRIAKPAAKAAVRGAMTLLRVRNGRRAGRMRETPDTTSVHILLMHAYGMGGTIRTVHNLAGYLSRDHSVTLYSVLRKVEEPFFPFPDGIAVVPLDDRTDAGCPRGVRGLACRTLSRFPSVIVHMDDHAYQGSSLWTDIQLLRTVRGLRSGVLITTRPALNLIAAVFAPPEVITVGQEHMNLATHRAGLRKSITRRYRNLDALAVLTETDRASYAKVLSSMPTRLVRIPNAVPKLEGGQADLDSKVVVAAGRLGNQKGFDMLIRAFTGVRAHHPDWKLRIYGSGQWRDRLQRMIADYGLSRHVSLMGRASNMGEELAKGSIYALSSRFEGFPMVLIEAMSKGLPVVAFDCPTGPAEVVVTGENGVLVERGKVEEFAAALNELIEDRDKRHACGAGAAKTARHYELDIVCDEWDALFNELATGT